MPLLNRIAQRQGDPQRTIAALRLIIAHLERDLKRPTPAPAQDQKARHQAQTEEAEWTH